MSEPDEDMTQEDVPQVWDVARREERVDRDAQICAEIEQDGRVVTVLTEPARRDGRP